MEQKGKTYAINVNFNCWNCLRYQNLRIANDFNLKL